ncbi:Methylated-DNA-[protein]-cysteine S-methyltransferase [Beggiatoa sp. PS]|nr:Methylated-DNA-[protein]-cysteine S-methyltransferase [Beggiatoa sp. PS]
MTAFPIFEEMRNKNDMKITPFQQAVYDLCSKIPSGRISTYKEIADAMGKSGLACRAVGMALNKNPFAPTVPCHRVIRTDGSIGGFALGTSNKNGHYLLVTKISRLKMGKLLSFDKKFFNLS